MKYDKILAAVEYKNNYNKAVNELKEEEIVKEQGFSIPVPKPSFYSFKLFKPNMEDNLSLSSNRIEYTNTNLEATPQTFKSINGIFEKMELEYKKLINPNPRLEYRGIVIRNIYETTSNLKKILNYYMNFNPEKTRMKKSECRRNFRDENELNYNLQIIQKNAEKIFVSLDINTRYLEAGKAGWNIEKLGKKINSYMKNTKNLKKLLDNYK